jgi:sterol desaturase/sphingolipid hydroxylase (fatty acid hydroxylase superfamily)
MGLGAATARRYRSIAMTDADVTFVRLGLFVGILAGLSLLERLRPGPNPAPQRRRRWPAHLALVALDTALARLLLPAGAVGAALWAQSAGWGVFHRVPLPFWWEAALSLLLMEVAIYWQHRWLHRVPLLWRLHRVHHSDMTLDASSALRFHPLEILVSLLYKMALVAIFGIDPSVVLVFEAILSSFALMTHANLDLPPRVDRLVRWVLVTPAMHRVHHSTRIDEQHRNYGFHLSVWDRLFGSYAERTAANNQDFGVAGIGDVDPERALRLRALLREPFRD